MAADCRKAHGAAGLPAAWRGLCSLAVLLSAACPLWASDSSAGTARLRVVPGRALLEGRDARQQLAVTLCLQDGSVRDVTSLCRFTVEPQGIARVTADGVALPEADGRALVRACFRGDTAQVELEVRRGSWQRPVSFRADVAPLLSKAGCNMGSCHGNAKGKEGFRLSLRGEDPAYDHQALTRDLFGRRLSRLVPGESLIVRKPTGMIAHEGGLRFARESVEARMLLRWIAAGAPDDAATAPRVQALRVVPGERIAAPGSLNLQLVISADLDDGTTRDITRQAAYDVSDPTRVEVTFGGLVRAKAPCEAVVAIRYMDRRCTSRLAFLPDRPGFVWRGPEPTHPIDKLVFAKLKALRINPSESVSDAAFLRRAYLDATGRLPEPEQTRSFLDDRDPGKRARLVDHLAGRAEFADFWALKWADVLRNEEKTMGEKGAWVLQRWLRDRIAQDTPLDELVRRIVAGLGSTWQNPPASFYRTNRDPMTVAESVSQVFLGVRLQCARCHNHPFDAWTQDDYYGLAAYFAGIARKEVNNFRKDRLDKHEINGDEVIYLEGRPELIQPRSGTVVQARWLDHQPAAAVLERTSANALEAAADRLTRNNPQFARNMANRIWFHLMGRGIVEPVDDFRDSNPPSNPALLEALTAYFEAAGMRLKPLVAWIMKSQTYQLSATPNPSNADDDANFSHALARLLPAEVLLDAIGQACGAPEPFPRAPRQVRAAQLPGSAVGITFLKSFGKPDRLLSCECERSDATTLAQAFQMISGQTVRAKLEKHDNRLGRRLAEGVSDGALLSELYLAALCREPSSPERAAVLAHLAKAGDRRKGWEDVLWALLNSKEFLLRH
jgi:Protein of unknown function (DUF1549)/Protein of unknown function (DUF1553)